MSNPLFDPQIYDLIPAQVKVLDLGCGSGELLAHLSKKKSIRGYGIDLNEANIQACVRKRIRVYQSTIESALTRFSDNSFDIIILSQTLQEMRDPLWVIEQSLRVGQTAIVSFPNFAYWQIRLQLLMGKVPKTKHLPYSWHDTPNIRIITIADFEAICQTNGIQIERSFSYSNFNTSISASPSNFWSQGAIYFLKKGGKND